jgi:hypothetical protein
MSDLPPGFRVETLGTAPPAELPAGNWNVTPPQEQMTGAMRYPALAGSYLAKGALASAGALGDLEGFLHRQFTKGVFDPLHRAVTGEPATRAIAAAAEPAPLSSTNLLAGGRAIGAVDRPNLVPQNTGEKYLAAGSEGVGGALPYLWMGGLNPAALARNTAQGAAAGAGGEAGAQAFPEYADAARAAAGLGGLYLGGKAFDLGNKAVSAARGATTPLQDAYRNLGISPDLAGDVTQSPFMQMLQGYAGKSPAGAGRVTAARERAVDQWGRALDDTAAGYGNATTLQEAGTTLQAESRAWMNQWRQAQEAAENAVAARVPPTAPVDLAPVNQVLTAATTRMPGLPTVAGIHDNPTFQRLRTALAQDAPTGRSTWGDIRQWRSAVGEELEQSLLSGDGNQAAWRQLYGALSRSLGDTAFANNAHQEWAAANQVTSQGHQFVENVVGKLINARNPASNTIAAEDAARAAMRGANAGGTNLQAIRQEMPAAVDDLAALKLRQSAMSRGGAEEVSPRTLVSELGPRKLAPEARDALFGGDPALAGRVEDLARVGTGMRGSERFFNPSGTGGHIATGQAVLGALGAPVAGYYGYQEGGGIPGAIKGAAGSLAAGFLPGYAAARAVTSPGLTRLLATPTQSGGPFSLPRTALQAYPELRGLLSEFPY